MARDRALIHVAGPKASGKTTFIEHVLRAVDGLMICVRAERDDRLRQPQESSPRNHAELRRYRVGGASGTALYRFPSTDAAVDPFFMAEFMQDFSTAVVIEGDRPLEYVDLAAFVAPPPPPGASLLRRVSRDRAAEEAARADALERLLRQSGGIERFMAQRAGETVLAFARRNPTRLEDTRTELLAAIEKSRRARPARPTVHWALAEGYEGLEHAQMVVVNVRDAGERRRGEAMLDEVARLREDDALFADVLGRRGRKMPITAVVADLGNRQDGGLRKALARMKRSMRRSA